MQARKHPYALKTAAAMVNRYRDRKGTVAACKLVSDELLAYRPRYGYGYERAAEAALGRLAAQRVDPRAVLARIVAFYLILSRRPYRTQREEDVALGRWVAATVPFRRKPVAERQPSVNAHREIGTVTREALSIYAAKMIEKYEAECADRASLIRASVDFDAPAD